MQRMERRVSKRARRESTSTFLTRTQVLEDQEHSSETWRWILRFTSPTRVQFHNKINPVSHWTILIIAMKRTNSSFRRAIYLHRVDRISVMWCRGLHSTSSNPIAACRCHRARRWGWSRGSVTKPMQTPKRVQLLSNYKWDTVAAWSRLWRVGSLSPFLWVLRRHMSPIMQWTSSWCSPANCRWPRVHRLPLQNPASEELGGWVPAKMDCLHARPQTLSANERQCTVAWPGMCWTGSLVSTDLIIVHCSLYTRVSSSASFYKSIDFNLIFQAESSRENHHKLLVGSQASHLYFCDLIHCSDQLLWIQWSSVCTPWLDYASMISVFFCAWEQHSFSPVVNVISSMSWTEI